jgi:hypothetical protein
VEEEQNRVSKKKRAAERGYRADLLKTKWVKNLFNNFYK